MKKKQEIVITFSPDGATELKVAGFKGKSCYDATRFLEETLGKVTSDKKTSDYYQKEKTGEKKHGRN